MTQQWPGNDPYAQNSRQASPWGQPSAPWGPPQTQRWRAPVAARRGNPIVRLVKGALLVVVLGFVGLLALGSWAAGHLSNTSSAQTSPETQAPTSPVTQASTTPTTVAPTPDAPAPSASQPAATASTSPTTVPTPASDTTYQNDSYVVPAPDPNPPALPEPETYQEATDLMRANPVYDTSVPRPVRCQMGEIDLETASKAQLTSHLNDLTGCLMRVWSQPLKQAGFEAVRPTVTVYDGSVTTKCGTLPSMNAVYCGADQQVYYAQNLPQVVPPSLRSSRFVTESVIAHEFGHAVQARSAILISEQAWEDRLTTKSQKNDLSRRLEQQADCFAGEFLGSIQKSTAMTPTELGNVTRLFYSIGDDVLNDSPGYVGNHGQGHDRQAWITKGIESTSVGACDTFTAPASAVR